MNKNDIFIALDKYEIDKDECIIISGASLVVQGIIQSTSDIDIATTSAYYNSLNWETKIGAMGKEIKCLDCIEISDNLYEPKEVVLINGYKFAKLSYVLKVKKLLNREKDKKLISILEKMIENEG